MKNTGLGRGLGALLGDAALQDSQSGGVMLKTAEIEPNMEQPRKFFDESALHDLAENIKENGVLSPLWVRRLPTGYYQIIAGERRWRAARQAGLSQVPAIIFEANDRRVMELALIENLQREDLDPIEEAEGYKALTDSFGLTQEEAAAQVGRSRPAVANALRLLGLPEQIKMRVSRGELSGGHARALLQLPANGLQEKAAAKIVAEGLSVRQTEQLVRKLCEQEKPEQAARPLTVNYLEEHERRLTERLGRRVHIVSGKKKGRVELDFYSPEDLESLLNLLGDSQGGLSEPAEMKGKDV